ncbi:MAG: Propanediol utilization protein PduV [Firmicutes bacterium ADurb.Bin182]|nr:MAG: Propanediol utilization protein PduV [Firmicutes bacterium ADurb.Bin182]
MKRIMFIGKSGCGKTTLIQSLQKLPQEYKKTQTVETVGTAIDTPGEYMERKNLFFALTVTAMDAEQILFVIDCTDDMTTFMPGMNGFFCCPVAGAVTKIDCAASRQSIENAKDQLSVAGAGKIFCVSSVTGEGMDALRRYLLQPV